MDKIRIFLTPQEVDYVVNTLANKPWREVDGIVRSIIEQARSQMPPPEAEPSAELLTEQE